MLSNAISFLPQLVSHLSQDTFDILLLIWPVFCFLDHIPRGRLFLIIRYVLTYFSLQGLYTPPPPPPPPPWKFKSGNTSIIASHIPLSHYTATRLPILHPSVLVTHSRYPSNNILFMISVDCFSSVCQPFWSSSIQTYCCCPVLASCYGLFTSSQRAAFLLIIRYVSNALLGIYARV